MMVIYLFIALFIVSLNVFSVCAAKQIIVPAARSDLSPMDVVWSTFIQYHKPCEISFHSPLSILPVEGRLSFCVERLIHPFFFCFNSFFRTTLLSRVSPLYKSMVASFRGAKKKVTRKLKGLSLNSWTTSKDRKLSHGNGWLTLPPSGNKGLIAGLGKGNQWLISS